MKLLRTITDIDIGQEHSGEDSNTYRHREAARAVIFDSSGHIPLLYVRKHSYHKLPGGGIEAGENIQTALRREIMEELGCEIDSIQELGVVDEVHDQERLTQRSYCYKAAVTKYVSTPAFTEEEVTDGFERMSVNSIDEAIELLSHDSTDDYVGKYIVMRDLLLLNIVKETWK